MNPFDLAVRAIFLAILAVAGAAAQPPAEEGISLPGPLHLRWQETTLELQVRLEEGNHNQALDAGEEAQVEVTVVNRGPSKAYQVEVEGRLKEAVAHLTALPLKQGLGTLLPGQSGQGQMTLTAGEDLASGAAVLRFEARDRYQREAQPVEMSIETRALVPPDLRLADMGIDDDDQGNSYGNANNRIEKGETIEVKAILQNQGQGGASQVSVEPIPPDGVFYLGNRIFDLGDLGPGEYRAVEFAFTVPPNYAGGTALPFRLKIGEQRRRFSREEVLSLSLERVEKWGGAVQPKQVVVRGMPQAQVAISQVPSLKIEVDVEIPQGKGPNPDGVAVVIGNRDYASRHREVPDVEFAIRDAAVVKEYLLKALGYQEGNILYYTNATNGDFRSLFGTREVPEGRLAHLVKPGKSEVFVYYSGHGAPDVGEQRGYFVPVDCAPGEVRLNGYPLDLFYENLGRLKARSIAVVIDACFSGGSQGGMLIAAASPLGIRVIDPALRLPNGAVFTSSSGEEISSWYPEMKHGLFTYFFLKGLQGAADANQDGQILAGELHRYLSDPSEGVPYWARRLYQGRQQTPGFWGNEEQVILEVAR